MLFGIDFFELHKSLQVPYDYDFESSTLWFRNANNLVLETRPGFFTNFQWRECFGQTSRMSKNVFRDVDTCAVFIVNENVVIASYCYASRSIVFEPEVVKGVKSNPVKLAKVCELGADLKASSRFLLATVDDSLNLKLQEITSNAVNQDDNKDDKTCSTY